MLFLPIVMQDAELEIGQNGNSSGTPSSTISPQAKMLPLTLKRFLKHYENNLSPSQSHRPMLRGLQRTAGREWEYGSTV